PARRCLLVGAYRDGEVGPDHPLAIAIRALARAQPVHTLELGPLGVASVAELLGDTLRAGAAETGPLAELVHSRTGGNPFFIAQLLDTLHERRLITYSAERGGWTWDLDAIRTAGITDDVVELMIEKLRRLSPAAQEAIRTGACIGNVFPVALIATIAQRDAPAVRADLDPSIEAGFVTAEGDEIRFVHDRIQQAAYGLIPEAERDEFHLQVGRLLLRGMSEAERTEHVFGIVLHLNRARRLIESAAERRQLLELNVIAAERARSAVAFAPFLDLIQVAEELLPADAWTADRALAARVHLDLAEACHVNRQYERIEAYARAVLDRSPTAVDAIRATSTLVMRSMAQGQPKEASRIGLELLNAMGFGVPLEPGKLDVLRVFLRVRLGLARHRIDRLAQRRETTDPEVIATAEFCMSLLSPLFYGAPAAFPIVGMKMLLHALRHGYTPISPAPFMMFAIILAQVGQAGQARRYAELAWRLQRRFGARKVEVYLHTGWNSFLAWRWMPYREILEVVESEATPAAVDVGNTEFVGHQLLNSVELRFLRGDALSDLADRCDRVWRQIDQAQQWVPLDALRVLRQVLANLGGGAPDPAELRGRFFDPDEVLARAVREGNVTGRFSAAAYASYTALLFGDPARALRLTREAEPLIPQLAAWYVHTLFYAVQSIALLQVEPSAAARGALRGSGASTAIRASSPSAATSATAGSTTFRCGQ
ncbi:MAG TPA: hypothetical protein VKB80_01395, partial [Kofleriaceae bacterium]|nr:hypothetical protein [Kofleriaceae bacterium]